MINLEFDREKSIYSTESSKMQDILRSLICSHNDNASIMNLLNEVPLLKEMYDKEMLEMSEHGNCGVSSCFCCVIKEAFDELGDLREDNDCSRDEKLFDENYELRSKVRNLEIQLKNIKDLLME